MWTVKSQPKSVKLNHALAKRFDEMKPAPSDRPLRGSRVLGLRNIIANGEFRTCEWASAHCKETGETYRINGKHTSSVFASMNGDAPKNVNVLISEYECDTLEDVAKLYCSFDTRQAARSTGDINRIYSATNPSLSEIPLRIISLAVTGIAYEMYEDQYHHKTPEDRAILMTDNPDYVVWLSGIVKDNKDCNLKRGAVAAAMFKTFKRSKSDSTKFWEMVRDGSGEKPTSPDRILSRMLDKSSVMRGRGVDTKKKAMASREMYVKCIHAWNAWRKSEPTDLKYYINSKTPAAV